MKKLSKALVAGAASAAMLFTSFAGMTSTAFAAEGDGTITINQNKADEHVYSVYQIFTGDFSDGVLSNVKWGTNAKLPDGAKVGDAVPADVLAALEAVKDKSDTEKLAVISQYANLSSNAVAEASKDSPASVAPGYYLLKDKANAVDNDTNTLYITTVVGGETVDVTRKADVPTSEKKVKDNDAENNPWQDSADYNIGDDVPFLLKATIAEDYDNYKVYKLTFNDSYDKVQLGKPENVTVKVGDNDITSSATITNGGDGSLKVAFADLKSIKDGETALIQKGSVITVEYTSELLSGAAIGAAGNKNTMHITFSNNPNEEQGGENGTTPDDTVVVFTYELDVNKVRKALEGETGNQPLQGAGFTLYRVVEGQADEQIGDEITGTDKTLFEFKGLDAGTYKLVETTTPAGYNTITPITFTITAEHEVESADPKLTKLEVTGAEGFTVNKTDQNTPTGVITTDIVNEKGSSLPSTGGMGTTILYTVGALIVLAAGAGLAITMRRRNNA